MHSCSLLLGALVVLSSASTKLASYRYSMMPNTILGGSANARSTIRFSLDEAFEACDASPDCAGFSQMINETVMVLPPAPELRFNQGPFTVDVEPVTLFKSAAQPVPQPGWLTHIKQGAPLKYSFHRGKLEGCTQVGSGSATFAQAQEACDSRTDCAGFSFQGGGRPYEGARYISLEGCANYAPGDGSWSSYVKLGHAAAHSPVTNSTFSSLGHSLAAKTCTRPAEHGSNRCVDEVIPVCVGILCGVSRRQHAPTNAEFSQAVQKLPGFVPRRVPASSFSAAQFTKGNLGHTPVIITGALDEWVNALSLENLDQTIGHLKYTLHFNNASNAGSNFILSDPNFFSEAVSFQQFLHKAEEGGHCSDNTTNDFRECTYVGIRVSMRNIPQVSHRLVDQLPKFLEDLHWLRLTQSGIWAAQRHLRVPPHVDGYSHRFMAHITGIKRVTLLPPGSIERMGDMDGRDAQSAVTAKAFLLHPGEMLYIPPCWLHQVYYVDFGLTAVLRFAVKKEYANLDYLACSAKLSLNAMPNTTQALR